jgi:hypothetical protein
MYHKMVHNGTSKVAQSCSNFECDFCDYTTSKKSSWEKHIVTKKHLNSKMVHKVAKSCSDERFTCVCGKSYKFHSGYYRHKSSCSNIIPGNKIDSELIEQIAKSVLSIFGNQNTINNTINNQKILNVNLFLNEQCANAMSIQDFAKQLHLSMEDLDKDKTECLTDVVIKNLKPLAITSRPFHCADITNSEWYIKDIEKGWESDTGEKVLNTAEYAITQKWSTEFEKQHPGWVDDEKHQEKYIKIAGSALSRLTSKDTIKVLRDISVCAKL